MAKTIIQPVTGTQNWKERMRAARESLPEGVGQQDVLEWITNENPDIDRLTFITRWKNAWICKNADPEFTELVEKAADHFKKESVKTRRRLGRQRLNSANEA